MRLREYQQNLLDQILKEGAGNTLAVLPTGGGKTVIFAKYVAMARVPAVIIAHRHELVVQISVALAREGIRHAILGQTSTISAAVIAQRAEVGDVYYDPDAVVVVASVDTLVRKTRVTLGLWADSVKIWVQDEAHHILRNNKWGRAVSLFPNARGLGVTATPRRADGRGLGEHADGVFDRLIVGPYGRELIDAGHLSEYRIFAPHTQDLDLSSVELGADGDYKPPQLRLAVQRSRIVGDVVAHYKRIAPGKLGVTFVTDTETGENIARAYCDAGIPARSVTHRTTASDRAEVLNQFRRRAILQLVNVDLFGEGFDLPAIECVSFARPTQSYAVYAQQFGRALRIMENKDAAVIIDHVGNVMRHGLPDAPRAWSLDAKERRSSTDNEILPIKVCLVCTRVYLRYLLACPYCGHTPMPARRNGPEHVDGDLAELDSATLDWLRAGVSRIDKPVDQYREELARKGCPAIGIAANAKRHLEDQREQEPLRLAIRQYGGESRAVGLSDRESWKKFYVDFGIDVLTAQSLRAAEAVALRERIER